MLLDGLLSVKNDQALQSVGVLLADQQAGLALSVADRAVVLDRGRMVASGPASHLAGDTDGLAAAYLGSRSRLAT